MAPTTSIGGHSCCLNFVAPMGPADQRAAEEFNSVLVYTSEPLVEPIELIGDVTVTLYAATSARDTDWTARLCEVHPDGRSINLQEGSCGRATGRASPNRRCWNRSASIATTSRSAPSGCASPLATGYASRSRAAISPQWDRNLNTGGDLFSERPSAAVVATQTVLHNAEHASHLTVHTMRPSRP